MTGGSLDKSLLVGLVLLLLLSMVGSAHAQDVPCTDDFRRANTVYLEGHFDETIRLLRACLDRETVLGESAIPAYRLLALAHLNQGETEAAEAAIAELLTQVSTYEADPIQDPPSYVSLVTAQQEEVAWQQESLAEAEAALPAEEEAVTPQPEASEETPRRVLDPPPAIEREDAGQAPFERVPQRQGTAFFTQPKSWLIAGGGVLVIFAALGLAVGGPNTGGQ